MPGVATAQLLTYAEIVDVDLDATNDVNFADVEDYGHRVLIDMNSVAINNYLGWQRNAGSARPSAKLNSAYEAAFKAAIEAALSDSFVDIDGVTGGLHFGTANFDTNTDPRKRSEGVSANDIPMCFVLYKLYGSSAVATLDNIFNLQDAHGMLSNATVSTAIAESFKTNEAGSLDTMFRDLLSADPYRFFDASGIPMTGIFETNADISGSGSWNITGNDIIEVKLKLIFQSTISRRGVAGRDHNLSSPENATGAQENQQTVISPSDYFYVRLQMRAIAPPAPPSSTVAAPMDGQASISFTPGSNGGKVITNYEYSLDNGSTYTAFSPAQTTSPVTISGLTNGVTYNIKVRAVNAIGTSEPSATVTVTPASAPEAPTTLSATASNGQAVISFVAGSDGGSAITNYKYSIDGGASFVAFSPAQTTSPVTISGLTGSSYNIQLKAVNAIGDSPASETVIVVLYSGGQAKIATRSGGAASGAGHTNIKVDSQGNVYQIVPYSDTLTIYNYSSAPVGGGEVATSIYGTLTSGSYPNITALIKYNSNGQVQWATRVQVSFDTPGALAVDSSGNVYYAAQIYESGSTLFSYSSAPVGGGNVGLTTYGTISGAGSYNFSSVVIKYNSSGSIVWATQLGGYVRCIGMGVDASGNIYIGSANPDSNWGQSFYNVVGAPLSAGGAVQTAMWGSIDLDTRAATIVKYNPSGIVQWATSVSNLIPGNHTNLHSGLTVDASGNVIIGAQTTTTNYTINAYNSAPVSGGAVGLTTWGTMTRPTTDSGIVLVKYNSSGTPLWATFTIGGGGFNVISLSSDAQNNLFVASAGHPEFNATLTPYSVTSAPGGGSAVTTTAFGSTSISSGTPYVIKYNSSGIVEWVNTTSALCQVGPSTCDSSGNFYLTTSYNSTLGSPATQTLKDYTTVTGGNIVFTQRGVLPAASGGDVYIIKYNSSGAVMWGTRVGGSSEERYSSVAVDNEGHIWVTGTYNSNPAVIMSFSNMPAVATNNVLLDTYGTLADVNTSAGVNVFLVKYQG